MSSQLLAESDYSTWAYEKFLLGCLGLLLYLLGIALVFYTLVVSEPSSRFLFASIVMAIFAYGATRNISQMKGIKIYADYIRIRAFFGFGETEILLTDIVSWSEKLKANTGVAELLILYTGTFSIEINPADYANYPALRNALIVNKPEATQAIEPKQTSGVGAGLAALFFGLSFLFSTYIGYNKLNRVVKPAELMTINATVASKPWHSITRKTTNEYLHFKLEQYPDVTFQHLITASSGRNIRGLPELIEQGDSISIDVLEETYRVVVLHEKHTTTTTYWTEDVLTIYGLRHRGNEYLSLANLNGDKTMRSIPFLMCFVIGMGMTMIGVRNIVTR